MGILPKIFPPFPRRRVDLHATIVPAKEVGGSFYDFVLFDDQELYVIIGDVSGKGVPASLFMAVTLTLFRASVSRGMSPGALLTKLNRDLCVENTSSLFVTVFCARVNVQNRDGRLRQRQPRTARIMSTTAADRRRRCRCSAGRYLKCSRSRIRSGRGLRQLAPGDTLVLFTDGITEASTASDELFGDDRLSATPRGTASGHARAGHSGRDCRRRPAVRRQRAPVGRSDAARAALPRRPTDQP